MKFDMEQIIRGNYAAGVEAFLVCVNTFWYVARCDNATVVAYIITHQVVMQTHHDSTAVVTHITIYHGTHTS